VNKYNTRDGEDLAVEEKNLPLFVERPVCLNFKAESAELRRKECLAIRTGFKISKTKKETKHRRKTYTWS
jgi:hypothetical protein